MDDNKSNQNNSVFDENCWIKGYSKVFHMFHQNQNALRNISLIMAAYINHLIAYKILYLTIYFVFKRSLSIFHIIQPYF